MSHIVKELSPSLFLEQVNQIPVLVVNHPVGQAKIALQGAQLLSWKPASQEKDVFWLSEIDPFEEGVAIRGGIPLCFPWFGGVKSPSHGTARLRLWDVTGFEESDEKVRLEFSLLDEHRLPEAKIIFEFTNELDIAFTNYQEKGAQLAMHTYFHIGNIEETLVSNLPETYLDAVTQTEEKSTGKVEFSGVVNHIYHGGQTSLIHDRVNARHIEVEHHDGSDIVVWNPWTDGASAMKSEDYKEMVCLETTRINETLEPGQTLSVTIRVNKG